MNTLPGLILLLSSAYGFPQEEPAPRAGSSQCCCVPAAEACGDLQGGSDLVGGGFIDARIVNRPSVKEEITACPTGQKTCCYNEDIDLSVFGKTCVTPAQANAALQGFWRQNCVEKSIAGSKECGTRAGFTPASGLTHGQSSPGEFPWTCLVLNQKNDFIGSCVVIPADFSNNNAKGTRKVVTAAHKLAKVGPTDQLKVRVGEYDASGFKAPETIQHQEYAAVSIVKHPRFNPSRLDNDLAIITVDKVIDLTNPTVNTACLPSCDDQFDFKFNNGTGTRCWVAGWGKDDASGKFQVVQRKVDIPIVDSVTCQAKLKAALNSKKPGVGDKFTISPSEICAGAEVGKDACTGDGGSPLVCQAQSGRWTVVGLVTWGVGCASDIPGVYARMSFFKDWIESN